MDEALFCRVDCTRPALSNSKFVETLATCRKNGRSRYRSRTRFSSICWLFVRCTATL